MSSNSPVSRLRIEPLAEKQFGFFIGQTQVTAWHFSELSPRPYLFPIVGAHGVSLTRMGHPGAPNHDHHRSVWFAHSDLLGIDFWSDDRPAKIRQTQWYAIEDGEDSATVALQLAWLDGHDPKALLLQNVFLTLRGSVESWTLEIQADFQATAEGVEFRQSNFGCLGVRVAKSLSVVFGGGRITGADGNVGEAALFGQPNRWVDYSGPIYQPKAAGGVTSKETEQAAEVGLTLIDHRDNPQHPVRWHIRDDGWIGPSLSRLGPVLLPRDRWLTYRYLLWVRSSPYDRGNAQALAEAFDQRQKLGIRNSQRPHHQFDIVSL